MSDRMFGLFREVVERARARCAHPDSTPAVQTTLTGHFLAEITKPPLHGYVLVNGLNPLLRRVFKSIRDQGGEDARQQMLAHWPTTEMRRLVVDISNAMVFVPSRDEFVELVPDALTIEETREAGSYLVTQGQDTMRRGRLLIRLSDLRLQDVDPPRPVSGLSAPEASPTA